MALLYGLGAAPAFGDPETEVMPVRGAGLAYQARGTGETVLALHGALSDLRVWYRLGPALAKNRRFVAYTQRYFGAQAWPDKGENFSRETHVADLIAFIEGLGAGPVHLVTWSYGGDIGTRAMLRRPDLFRSAAHYEPSLGTLLGGVEGGADAEVAFTAAFAPTRQALQAGKIERAAILFLETVFGLPAGSLRQEPEPLQSLVRDNARTLPAFLQMPAGPPVSCRDLAGIAAPVLIVRGEHTHARYSLIAERMASCLPKAELTTLVGAGHDGPYWDPEDFAAMIRDFHAGLE